MSCDRTVPWRQQYPVLWNIFSSSGIWFLRGWRFGGGVREVIHCYVRFCLFFFCNSSVVLCHWLWTLRSVSSPFALFNLRIERSEFSCLLGQDETFVISRVWSPPFVRSIHNWMTAVPPFCYCSVGMVMFQCWHSYGAPDSAAPVTLANAYAAGVKRGDVYLVSSARLR